MAFLFGVIAFVVALLTSVMLHEAGHFLTAKRYGMKATQFFVGFGPTIWSRKPGETEYGIKAILLGGYVRIIGYTPLEQIDPKDRRRAFYLRPASQRAVVIGAGVVMNFVLGFVLIVILVMSIGLRDNGTQTTLVESVSPCVPATLENAACGSGSPASPAAQAGLRAGDKIVSWGGRPVSDWDDLRTTILAATPGTEVPVVVVRGSGQQTLRVRPAAVEGDAFLGMSPRIVGEGWDRKGPVDGSVFAVKQTGSYLAQMGRVFVDLPAAIPKLFSPDRAQTAGGQVSSVVGAGQVSGDIFASSTSWREKTYLFLWLVISVNIFVGALNLLPLLPLDGGHLAVVCYERIRARIARMRGRPDPGTVDMTKLLPVTYVAVVLLVGLGVLLILADVINPLKLPQ
jgi:membrane-associated protease RseP (regulator of RpoE activity)